jgi:uncharacterized membrane protein
MSELLFVLILASALGCGLAGGVFFAFSTFIMKALSRLPPEQGIAAMQAINVAVISPLFMTLLFGTAIACVALAFFVLTAFVDPAGGCLLAGSLLYLLGTVLVTIACNVPWNERLARITPASLDAGRLWTRYVQIWTVWNHVRTATSFGSSAFFILALCSRP